MDPKVSTLRLISENKNILFASNKISEEIRKIKWDEIAQYAKLVGILKENENGKYMRTVKWKNWRKRVVRKKTIGIRHGTRMKLNTADEIILDIIPSYGQLECIKRKREDTIEELNIKIARMKTDLMSREIYLKDIEIYGKETKLQLNPSEYTKQFYNNKSIASGSENDSLLGIFNTMNLK